MGKAPKPQSVTIVGGKNVTPPPPKQTNTKPAKAAPPEKPTEPTKEPETE